MAYSDMQRFMDVIQGRRVDRVPVLPLNALWVASNFPDREFAEVASDPRLLSEAQVWARELLGYDWLDPHADPLYIPEAFGCKVRFLPTGPIIDPVPTAVRSLEDVEGLPLPDVHAAGRLPVILETTRLLSEFGKGDIPLVAPFEGPFTTTCRIFEAEMVMRMVYKQPKVLEALLDKITDFLIAFGLALIESGANVALIPEPTASSAMISPRMFLQFVVPRYQKLTRKLGVPCVLHICGNTLPILSAMSRTGVDVLSLDQCMDLTATRGQAQGVVLGGNVDPVNVLLLGDTEKVAKETLKCLELGGSTRFMLMTGCAVPPNTPLENLKTMTETAISHSQMLWR